MNPKHIKEAFFEGILRDESFFTDMADPEYFPIGTFAI